MIHTRRLFTLLLGIFLITACQEKKRTVEQIEDNTPVITVKAPSFNADSAYRFVAKQVSFGPRVPNTQAHRQTGEYLINTFKRYGAEVTIQDFVAEAYTGAKLQSRNIIAAFYPQQRKRILWLLTGIAVIWPIKTL
jgi:hypothetical protein